MSPNDNLDQEDLEEQEEILAEHPEGVEVPEVLPVEVPKEPGPEDETDDEREQFGRRAQKRIGKLVKVRNELQEKLTRLQAERDELKNRLESDSSASQAHAAVQHEQRLDETEKRLKAEFLVAEEEADVNRKYDITRNLARIEAERLALNTWKARQPRQEEKPERPSPAEQRQAPRQAPQVDPLAKEWFEENRWFTVDQDLTKTALDIDRALQAQGFDPAEPPDQGERFNDYYKELNAQLRRRAPDKFQTKPSGNAVVAPGTRNGGRRGSKQTVTLTPSERQRARNLGISEADYAKEKLKLMQSRGEL